MNALGIFLKRSKKMVRLKSNPHMYSAKLWPREIRRLELLIQYLESLNPGPRISFADCVRWLLNTESVREIIGGDEDFA